MRRTVIGVVSVLALLALPPPPPAAAQATLPTGFADDPVVGGLTMPVAMAFLPDGRLLLVEQLTGRLRLIVNGSLSTTDPVATIPDVRTDNPQRGMYGIAIDPRWPASPYVYLHYCTASLRVMIARYTATGDVAYSGTGALTIDPASRYIVLNDARDGAHNGGTLRFGPDQMLYASIGDSIYSSCAAQDTVTFRGVILRMDIRSLPAGPGGPASKGVLRPSDNPFASHPNLNARLVWATGLRNPFRFQIDTQTGALFIADVGEFGWEEIDYAGSGGANFGWPLYEAFNPFTTCPRAVTSGFTWPIYTYPDTVGRSIMSAGVYRRGVGSSVFPPSYEGDFFLSDYYGGFLRRLHNNGSGWSIASAVGGQPNATDWATGLNEVTDWAQARDGSLWYLRQAVNFQANTGQIRRIRVSGPLAVETAPLEGIALATPRPMPSRGAVSIAFTLPRRAGIELAIHDAGGRRVRLLLRGESSAGVHEATWDGRDEAGRSVSPGVFWARLSAGGMHVTKRLIMLQ